MGRSLDSFYSIFDHLKSLRQERLPTLAGARTDRIGYSIYALVDPRDGKTRWVGITTNLSQRFEKHTDLEWGTGAWIADLYPDEPLMKVQCVVETREEAERIETALIELFRKRGAPLLNKALESKGGRTPLSGRLSMPEWVSPHKSSDRLLKRETKEEARARRQETRRRIEQGARMSEIDK